MGETGRRWSIRKDIRKDIEPSRNISMAACSSTKRTKRRGENFVPFSFLLARAIFLLYIYARPPFAGLFEGLTGGFTGSPCGSTPQNRCRGPFSPTSLQTINYIPSPGKWILSHSGGTQRHSRRERDIPFYGEEQRGRKGGRRAGDKGAAVAAQRRSCTCTQREPYRATQNLLFSDMPLESLYAAI